MIQIPEFSSEIRKYALARFFQFLAYQMLLAKFFSGGAIAIVLVEVPVIQKQLKVFDPLGRRLHFYRQLYLFTLLLWKGMAILYLEFYPSPLVGILFVILLHLSMGLETLLFIRISSRLEEKYHGEMLRYIGFLQLAVVIMGILGSALGVVLIIEYLLAFSFLLIPAFLVAWASIFPKEAIYPD